MVKLFVEQDKDGRPFPVDSIAPVWFFMENIPDRYEIAVARPSWKGDDYKGTAVTLISNGRCVRFNPIDPDVFLRFPAYLQRMFADADRKFSS